MSSAPAATRALQRARAGTCVAVPASMLWPFRKQQLVIAGAALAAPLAGALALAGLRTPDVAVLEPRLGALRAAALPAAPAINASPPDEGERPRSAHRGFVGVLLSHRSVDLAARNEGRLSAVHVRLGDRVAAGALLATLDLQTLRSDTAIAAAALRGAELALSRAREELAEAEARRRRKQALAAEGLASGEDLSAAEHQTAMAGLQVDGAAAALREKRARVGQLRRVAADTEIRAPFAGRVVARYAEPGESVGTTLPILRLISDDGLLVRFAVPEEHRPEVDENAGVRVRAGGLELRGTVETIAPEIDAVSRAVVVEARIEPGDAPRERLVAGEMARVFPAEGAP
ncbi:efflux RND transporter periplasmic adaptor subunit [Sorangium sp. So ce233]|uniref:efflux RND transporter periplasmic adaptor subunit n=1 Tax=Sorangium sp. So ce233 TaxID=3133290 RepID=UPI003F608E96